MDKTELDLSAMDKELRITMNLSDDWTMRDFPWMKQEYMEELMGIFGEGNFKFVSGSKRSIKGDTQVYTRATLFINKQGRENFQKYAEQVQT
jgi:hypothetical protein